MLHVFGEASYRCRQPHDTTTQSDQRGRSIGRKHAAPLLSVQASPCTQGLRRKPRSGPNIGPIHMLGALHRDTPRTRTLKPRLPRRGAESTRTCQTPAAPSARRARTAERSRPSSPVMPGNAHAVRGVQELWHRCGGIDAGTCSTPAVAEPHAASPPSGSTTCHRTIMCVMHTGWLQAGCS